MALGLLVSIPREVAGQAQSPSSAQHSPELQEAERLNQQVVQLYQQGKYIEAIPLAERALAIREKVLGREHPDVASSLNNLAALYKSQGNYAKAEPLYLRALTIREKVLGREHPDVATSLNNLAFLYESQGNYSKAEPLYLRSLAILEKVLGREHPLVASSLNNLAGIYRLQGNYAKAEPLLVRSLAIREKVLGREHPDVATSLNNLAVVYYSQGNYAKAEPLYLRSLAIREKVLGREHPDVALSLNNLAELYRVQGNYSKAEPLLRRSLAIREKVLGREHPDVALSLNNLAALYDSQGNYSKAEPLLRRSLAIYEKVLGREHPNVAGSLNNLAGLYQSQGNYGKAEPLFLRSLAILEKVLGREHPDVATSLNNLAFLYFSQGNYGKAEPLYLHALAIREKVLGREHPNVAATLNNLSGLYWRKGDITRTIDFLTRGLTVEEKNLQLIYAVGSEQRKQNYAQTFTGSTDFAVTLAIQQSTKNPTLGKLALTTVLRRKGRVLDAMTDTVQILRTQLADNPETKKLFDEWLDVQQRLANLVYRGQGEEKFEIYQQQIKQLEAEHERLEEQLSARSAEFRKEIQPVELADIQAQIPQDAAMVEIVQYKPFNPKGKNDDGKWGESRYAAVVLRTSGEPKWVDLGDDTTIDKSIASFRRVLARGPATSKSNSQERRGIDVEPAEGKSLEELARTLDKQVMAPIRPLLGDVRHLLLSPDGQLNLIPFEALKDEQNKYLVQRYAFSYLTTGRDLLRLQTTAKQLSNPVVFANIDYQQQETVIAANPTAKTRGSQNQRSVDFANLTYQPLKATLEEGEKIKEIFPKTNILIGEKATEAAIKQLKTPNILHLATHGFFLPDKELKPIPSAMNDLNQLEKPKYFNLENPLLRSGLALAGFNSRQNKQSNNTDDGVLTALEVAGLNLRGTELVVLSACETGVGDVKTGDGVYGLRRALVIAGSQTQLLSLWLVDDGGTKDLMVKYYEKVKAGKGRHEALRETQLEFLNNPKYQHPYYWASFIPSGNWRRMK
ncbi:MAG: tetratricopeptide repeat protein [Cyanomargarita calcarea GSE-NOS-MK-12-04C]|jgi:CHAT domain-containing protein/Tfp pilus assembly protein PilF|uniref:Tetratricopeptide repeat protein n=1 Tax=Cyanomargarita calcarea GSE-NOS-MK-12-04C TaxID=2839659 RepID=A0A951QTC7_9CYAN|nr:tetratricopeptide repeat protein [Cyanomargarita calcarea GSE-NOS-MK-12-04C]